MEETFTFIISLFLILFVSVDAFVAWLLTKSKRVSKGMYPALNERALVAQTSLASGVILALLGANRIFTWEWSSQSALILLSIALLIKSIPGIIWLSYWTRGKFAPHKVEAEEG